MSAHRTVFGQFSDSFLSNPSDEKRPISAGFGRFGQFRTHFTRYETSRAHMRRIGKTRPNASDPSEDSEFSALSQLLMFENLGEKLSEAGRHL